MQTRPFAQTPTYDPGLLGAALRDAGFEGTRRTWLLFFTFVSFAIGFWWDGRYKGAEAAVRQRRRAIWLRERFVMLGPTFVKIGQVLSTRPDLVPLPYVDEMASLQDQVPPFDNDLAHRIIAEELVRPIDEIFAVINPFPIAAASIGQVYKAKLLDGTDVVVKVQRPGLIPIVTLDLAILRRLTTFIDRHPRLSRGMPYTAILDEFGITMFEQADYAKEGHYAERFRENFKHFPKIGTPRIHWDLTTSRVMTMDFVHGMKVTDLVALEDAGVSFQEVVRIGVRATIKQILEDGFFHADVHPGNLFVDYQGTLVYIDFGMAGELSPYVQEKIVDIFLHSVHRNFELLVQDFIDLEFLSPKVDRVALQPVAQHIFDSQYGGTDRRLTVKEVFTTISDVLYEYPFRIPEKIAFILRTIITLEGIIHKLWPDFRFLEVAGPYAAKIMLTDAKASIREKLVDELFIDGEFRPNRLASLFGTATKEPTFRFGEVAPAVVKYLVSPEGKRVRNGLLSIIGKTPPAGEGGEAAWAVYLERAAEERDWSLDELLAPVLAFLRTPDGAEFLGLLLERRALLSSATSVDAGLGNRLAAAVEGRDLSQATIDDMMHTVEALLAHDELTLQPLVELAAAFLRSPAGEGWFYRLGAHLEARGGDFGGRFVEMLSLASHHPHLDVAPLVRAFFALAMKPEGKAWQDLMVRWFRAPGESKGDGIFVALQPLLADGRLRVSDIAVPALGFFFTKEGQPLRDEVIGNLRGRLGKVDWSGMAQGLWHAAGNALSRWRGKGPEHPLAPPPQPEETPALPETTS